MAGIRIRSACLAVQHSTRSATALLKFTANVMCIIFTVDLFCELVNGRKLLVPMLLRSATVVTTCQKRKKPPAISSIAAIAAV